MVIFEAQYNKNTPIMIKTFFDWPISTNKNNRLY